MQPSYIIWFSRRLKRYIFFLCVYNKSQCLSLVNLYLVSDYQIMQRILHYLTDAHFFLTRIFLRCCMSPLFHLIAVADYFQEESSVAWHLNLCRSVFNSRLPTHRLLRVLESVSDYHKSSVGHIVIKSRWMRSAPHLTVCCFKCMNKQVLA